MKQPSKIIRQSRIIICFIVIVFAGGMIITTSDGCSLSSHEDSGLDELYSQVDHEIAKSSYYMAEKEKRIESLKRDLASEKEVERRLHIYDNLITEYESYISDSALNYTTEAQRLAEKNGNQCEQIRLQIKKADIASHAGLFSEAHDMLDSVPRAELDSLLLANYFATYCSLYQYECEYVPDGEYSARSSQLRNLYIDSLMLVSDPESFEYLSNWLTPEIIMKIFCVVKKRLEETLKKQEQGTRQYSIIASIMAFMYQEMGNEEEYKRYLSKTVISDIQGTCWLN